jgi:spore germination protein KC
MAAAAKTLMSLRKLSVWFFLAAWLLGGCWDKLEVEDQLFPVTMGIDRGEQSRYRIAVRIPISAAMRAGILGGQTGEASPAEVMAVEADTVVQGIYILNASVGRRITLRHLRGIAVGEELARGGLRPLLSELQRNAEIRETAGFWVARGSATETLRRSKPTGELNPAKINEGLLLVEKGLHMAPPIRLQQILMRHADPGIDAFAPVVGLNRRIVGGDGEQTPRSAVAGDLNRMGRNPMEIAGTAVLRGDRLAGFLTVDETQALLALRGEMGKAYMTLPDPLNKGRRLTIRYQQENKPKNIARITPDGPQVTVRLLLEGEVLSGTANYRDPAQRRQIEQAAASFMEEIIRSVLRKTIEWQADPVGYGLLFRTRFATWDAWVAYRWRKQIPRLRVQVDADMRIRRFGLIHQTPAGETETGEE